MKNFIQNINIYLMKLIRVCNIFKNFFLGLLKDGNNFFGWFWGIYCHKAGRYYHSNDSTDRTILKTVFDPLLDPLHYLIQKLNIWMIKTACIDKHVQYGLCKEGFCLFVIQHHIFSSVQRKFQCIETTFVCI